MYKKKKNKKRKFSTSKWLFFVSNERIDRQCWHEFRKKIVKKIRVIVFLLPFVFFCLFSFSCFFLFSLNTFIRQTRNHTFFFFTVPKKMEKTERILFIDMCIFFLFFFFFLRFWLDFVYYLLLKVLKIEIPFFYWVLVVFFFVFIYFCDSISFDFLFFFIYFCLNFSNELMMLALVVKKFWLKKNKN